MNSSTCSLGKLSPRLCCHGDSWNQKVYLCEGGEGELDRFNVEVHVLKNLKMWLAWYELRFTLSHHRVVNLQIYWSRGSVVATLPSTPLAGAQRGVLVVAATGALAAHEHSQFSFHAAPPSAYSSRFQMGARALTASRMYDTAV